MAIGKGSWGLEESKNVTVFKKCEKEDLGNYSPVNLTLITGKVMEQIILENISKHMKNMEVAGSNPYGFAKKKLCLTW